MKFIRVDSQSWCDFEGVCELRIVQCSKSGRWALIALDSNQALRFVIKSFGGNDRKSAEKSLADIAERLNAYQPAAAAVADDTDIADDIDDIDAEEI